MPDPLPCDVVARLKSDQMAALAAAIILAGSFPDLVSWAMKAFGGQREGGSNERPSIAVANGAKPPGSVLPRAFVEGSSKGRGNGAARSDVAKEGPSRQGAPEPA